MTYALIDDRFDEHPKHLRAGWDLETYGLQICSITYANRHLTDGFVPRSAVARFGLVDSSTKLRRNLRLASKLISDGFWKEVDGGFEILGFLDHNPSRAEVASRRADLHEKRAAAGRAGGLRSAQLRATKETAPSKQVASTVLEQIQARSDPIRSDPNKEDPPVVPLEGDLRSDPEVPVRKRRRGVRVSRPEIPLPDGFTVSAKIVAICRQEGLPDPELGLRDMRDWAESKGVLRSDWEATFRKWMRDPRTFEKFGKWEPPKQGKTDPLADHLARQAKANGSTNGAAPQRTLEEATGWIAKAAKPTEEAS